MSISIFRPATRHANPKATSRRKASGFHFLPSLESMEARLVLSHMAPVMPPAAHVAPSVSGGATVGVSASLPISVSSLNLTNVVTNASGAVTSLTGTVTGLLANHQFTAPLTLSTTPTSGSCPVLNLELGPIHLNLLGLKVDTSPICLNLTGTSGNGNLLGNLVCKVANLLNTPLATSGGVNGLLSTANSLLNNATGTLTTLGANSTTTTTTITGLLGSQLSSALGSLNLGGAGAPAIPGGNHGACHILNLSVGPVNLDLLGLNVQLNNCNNGPITVKINAIPGQGNLLGNLLCDLAGLLNNPNSTVAAIDSELATIISKI